MRGNPSSSERGAESGELASIDLDAFLVRVVRWRGGGEFSWPSRRWVARWGVSSCRRGLNVVRCAIEALGGDVGARKTAW